MGLKHIISLTGRATISFTAPTDLHPFFASQGRPHFCCFDCASEHRPSPGLCPHPKAHLPVLVLVRLVVLALHPLDRVLSIRLRDLCLHTLNTITTTHSIGQDTPQAKPREGKARPVRPETRQPAPAHPSSLPRTVSRVPRTAHSPHRSCPVLVGLASLVSHSPVDHLPPRPSRPTPWPLRADTTRRVSHHHRRVTASSPVSLLLSSSRPSVARLPPA